MGFDNWQQLHRDIVRHIGQTTEPKIKYTYTIAQFHPWENCIGYVLAFANTCVEPERRRSESVSIVSTYIHITYVCHVKSH